MINRRIKRLLLKTKEGCLFLPVLSLFFYLPIPPAESAIPINQYTHRVYTKEHGLPQNTIQAVVQTPDGYLWLGTQEGLVRFDGIKAAVFNKKNTPEFRHNDVRVLFVGPSGRLWIGTSNGLLSYQDGRFTTHFNGQTNTKNNTNALFEDAQGTVWMGTYGGGLNILKDGRFTSLTTKEGLSGDMVNAIYVDRHGALWIGTYNGLNRIKDGRISLFTRTNGLPHDFIVAIMESSQGDLWIGTRGGLARMKGDKIQIYTKKNGLTDDIVKSLYEDRQGNIWIGMEAFGLLRFTEEKFSSFASKDGLSDNQVTSLCQDREGILWVGTYGGGLNRLWEGKFETYSTQQGLPVKEIRTILQKRDGSIWMGTREGGVIRLEDGKISSYSTKDGLPDNTIRALFEDKDGRLWLGSNNGLSCFQDGRFINYFRKDGLAHEFVRCIVQDHSGKIWLGTTGGGLHLFQDGRLINYRDKGIPWAVIRCLMVGQDGSLWIGSNDGLDRMKDGRVIHYSQKDGLSPDPVYALHEDKDQTLWIGSYGGGFCRFKDGRFTRYTEKDGLFDDIVYQILDDDRGDLWMSCNIGLYRVSKQSLNDFAEGKIKSIACVSYGTADGMRNSECNGNAQPSGWKTSDGRLWFPTTDGAVVINPKNISQNSLPPLVVIDQVVINGRTADISKPAEVSPGSGRLDFYFAGLSFIAPEKVKFKYRLEGFDPDWMDSGTRRDAFYTNIPPGSYRFRIMACNNDGLWNSEGASYSFRLKPYFRQTVWFYGLIILAVFLSGYGVHRKRVSQLKTRERELAGLVAEKTQDLAKANQKLEEVNTELERLANLDGLTGVSNHRNFMNILDLEWRRAERQAQPLSLIMADVDNFKAYNDNYGHQAGDQCLKTVAAIFKETVTRAGDLVGRYGGEEFIILLPATDIEGAFTVAERLRMKIDTLKIQHGHSFVCDHLTVSFGVAATIPKRHLSKETLIKASDDALYEAKHKGRNCCKSKAL